MEPRWALSALLGLVVGVAAASGCNSGSASTDRLTGQTTFDSEESTSGRGLNQAVPGAATAGAADSAKTSPPSGRTGPVEEADIYRIDGNHLFYLNTYRGFLIYDIEDPKNPRAVSRLPVYGYPIEMFVQGNTVYALLSDALYMTQSTDKVHFERHNVSQLVAIDITDIAHPTVLKTIDIVGQLREGVSRKIENTVYVVSYVPQAYYWGWRYELGTDPQKEQAWVYSFNVADPSNVALVQKLKIFEGGSVSDMDPVTGGQVTRYFNDVSLSATSNALMVVENWQLSSWSPGPTTNSGMYTCGVYSGDQRAVVSLVDISDPAGAIRLHAHFQTRGSLSDQFKQTYVYDDAAKTGTYYGLFARQAWASTNDCSGNSFIQNTMESWDVTTAGAPARLDSLNFGKAGETVRGTTFDVSRKAAYAITARNIDPLYVLDFADRAHLTIRSQIDGLSGDMSVFRLVENNNYLVGIGPDTSVTCTGFQGSETRRSVGIAVSLIDVRNLDAIRLVQRQCVAVDGDWVSSQITWNMDQAHKMIGLQTDGSTNVITIPVSYSKRVDDQANSWWWYRYETAVGIMSWDLSQYDPAKAPADQTVIKNFGTYVHPNGEVRRSIVFTHQGASPRRMMINLSDTHISIADIQDLAQPIPQAVVEVAPYVGQIFQFGDYVVESISDSPYYWAPQQGLTEFRVKRAGGELDQAPIVAQFSASQVQSVFPHGDQLVVFRADQDLSKAVVAAATTQVLVFDLADPTTPRLAGSTRVAGSFYPYFPFFCGMGWGYWFNYGQTNWTDTTDALVFLQTGWDQNAGKPAASLLSLGLADPANPTVSQTAVPTPDNGYLMGLVPDAGDKRGFFLSYADYLGPAIYDGSPRHTRNYAQRFHPDGEVWAAEQPVNLPGQLTRTWTAPSGERAYLTSDYISTATTTASGTVWRADTRLNLLRGATDANGRLVAELRATHRFENQYVSDMVLEGDALFVNVGAAYGSYGYGVVGGAAVDTVGVGKTVGALITNPAPVADPSDRLVAFDLSRLSLNRVYDQPTGTQGVQFMGTHGGQLFVNLSGDGILAVDVSNPAKPVGRQFLRTLGWATHIVFAGDNAYVAAGYFGVYGMGLKGPATLPASN